MKNDLELINNKELIGKAESNVDSILKPLIKEIFLFDTKSTASPKAKSEVLNSLSQNDELELKLEKSIFSDDNINLYKNGEIVSKIPEADTKIFARLMEAGKLLKARIKEIKNVYNTYEFLINIYLIDF